MNSLVFCEGYQDRAFLSAWIDYLAERGDTFFQQVWRRQDVREHLEADLKPAESILLGLL